MPESRITCVCGRVRRGRREGSQSKACEQMKQVCSGGTGGNNLGRARGVLSWMWNRCSDTVSCGDVLSKIQAFSDILVQSGARKNRCVHVNLSAPCLQSDTQALRQGNTVAPQRNAMRNVSRTEASNMLLWLRRASAKHEVRTTLMFLDSAVQPGHSNTCCMARVGCAQVRW